VNVAAVHHLPTGGAVRVLAEWLARTQAQELTVYTRDAAVHEFVPVPARARVIERPLRPGNSALDEIARLARSPRDGAELAREIDAGGHDAVFCFASVFTQAPDVLPFLRTPHLFYAPEPLRSAYEPPWLRELPPGWRGAITRRGINPIELRRRQLDRRYIRSASPHIVTHSAFTQGTLRCVYGVASEVVHLGVDARAFSPGEAPREGYVLSVGALHPLKGHDRVIEALATLSSPRPRLVLIGDRGGSEQALHALAQARGVELDIRSRLPFADVVGLYQRAGVVACAQIREPFGLVPLEAMACATPVVAVAEGGFRETIQDGVTGLLVAPDPDGSGAARPGSEGAVLLGAAIARVLSDEGLAIRLGATGREVVERDWTWTTTAAAYDRLLQELAQPHRSSTATALEAPARNG
jgi:glycosyltransferase involved in cell wall biosynthesis